MRQISRNLFILAGTCLSFQSASAKTYPEVYPFIPMSLEGVSGIYYDVRKVTEDRKFLKGINDIVSLGYDKEGKTETKPWSSSYWPLSKGVIADPYEESSVPYYVDWSWVEWEGNVDEFKKRKKEILSKVYELSEEELEKLAPSEKYDLLLGDLSFDLTHRLWDYMSRWGSKKENGFKVRDLLVGEDMLEEARNYVEKNWYTDVKSAFKNSWTLNSSFSTKFAVEMVESGEYPDVQSAWPFALEKAKKEAKNYVEEEKNSFIAGWEGICNGWSTSAGTEPRPRKSVSFKLPNGKKLKFFPDDIKGLVSLYYFNSIIQNEVYGENLAKDGVPNIQGTVSVGLRCNLQRAKRDEWGRMYDHVDDPFNGPNSFTGRRDSRCAGVHPAKWYLGLVNLIGKQGRSFIVERKVGPAVDNHPMYSYKMRYFNPNSGYFKDTIYDAIVPIDKNDQFRKFRNKEAKYIVGVENVVTYLDYKRPKRKEIDSEKEDSDVDRKMWFDLELDKDLNVVGGQWRAKLVGKVEFHRIGGEERMRDYNHKQPDFFWVLTKNYKDSGLFDDEKDLETWSDKSKVPPKSWKEKAIGSPLTGEGFAKGQTDGYHGYYYNAKLRPWGSPESCRMKNKKTDKLITTLCDFETNKPQPLINVVNALLDLAK